mmetsp:Transcript_20906/g.50318  ORF Transcript_20906/g.50318 Transcript_20906/m.50318 type:complete len:303 (+) Transcript_20906:973-1881(+)
MSARSDAGTSDASAEGCCRSRHLRSSSSSSLASRSIIRSTIAFWLANHPATPPLATNPSSLATVPVTHLPDTNVARSQNECMTLVTTPSSSSKISTERTTLSAPHHMETHTNCTRSSADDARTNDRRRRDRDRMSRDATASARKKVLRSCDDDTARPPVLAPPSNLPPVLAGEFLGRMLPELLARKPSLAISPRGSSAAHSTPGSQCQMANARRGFNQTHKFDAKSRVRVTSTCRRSSPSPPPGCEYSNLSSRSETAAAANDERRTAVWAGGARAISLQEGWAGWHSPPPSPLPWSLSAWQG